MWRNRNGCIVTHTIEKEQNKEKKSKIPKPHHYIHGCGCDVGENRWKRTTHFLFGLNNILWISISNIFSFSIQNEANLAHFFIRKYLQIRS